jgi:hypothetical protein
MNIMTIAQPSYSTGMVPLDYFLFPRVKVELAVISKMQETLQKAWDGVPRTVAKEDFVAAFRLW